MTFFLPFCYKKRQKKFPAQPKPSHQPAHAWGRGVQKRLLSAPTKKVRLKLCACARFALPYINRSFVRELDSASALREGTCRHVGLCINVTTTSLNLKTENLILFPTLSSSNLPPRPSPEDMTTERPVGEPDCRARNAEEEDDAPKQGSSSGPVRRNMSAKPNAPSRPAANLNRYVPRDLSKLKLEDIELPPDEPTADKLKRVGRDIIEMFAMLGGVLGLIFATYYGMRWALNIPHPRPLHGDEHPGAHRDHAAGDHEL